jgi:pimeloyl-ACP methyl ester carboxylesterase
MPVIEVNSAKINYMQLAHKGAGAAEDLVMVHGLAANMAFWLQDYAPHFAERFRVTLYDMRGHGRSQTTDNGYSAAGIAADLAALLDTLGIKKAHIIAHSFGGLAAMTFAARFPERVSSLVLCDTQIDLGRAVAKTMPWPAGDAIQKAFDESGVALNTRDPYFGFRLITEVARIRKEGRDIPEPLMPWVQHVLSGNDSRTAEKWLALIDGTQARDELTTADGLDTAELKKITCPVLALYGENSQSMATGNILKSLWPQIEFVTIPKAGHFFPRAQPELIMSLCDKFWDTRPSERRTA